MRIIDKTGPLANPADRDHCIQYMVAIPLLFGRLTAADYEDQVARDPRVDALRAKMQVRENPAFTQEYYAPDKRYIGNAVQVFFKDGTREPARRRSTIPSAIASAAPRACRCWSRNSRASVAAHFGAKQSEAIKKMFADRTALSGDGGGRFHGAVGERRLTPTPSTAALARGKKIPLGGAGL